MDLEEQYENRYGIKSPKKGDKFIDKDEQFDYFSYDDFVISNGSFNQVK